jgi:TRAP-type C4-dicarboxylate transport system permease small subunit
MDETTPKLEERRPILWKIEEGICYFSLACLVFIPLADTFLRHAFNSRFPAAPPLMSHLLLALGLLSGMITTRTGDHLSIGLFQFFDNRKLKITVTAISALASAFLVTVFGWCSASFIRVGLYPVQMVGFIPDRVFALVLPIGYGVIALRFARRTGLHGKARVLPVLALFLGTLVSLPVIFKLLWGLDLPDFAWDLTDVFRGLAELLRMPVVIILVFLALIGTPIFVVIGGFSLILLQSSWGEIDIVASQIYTALTQNSLIAIPLFTLTGFILSESRAGERLVETFKSFFGWIPGGTIIVTVCAKTIPIVGGILSILALAQALSYYILDSRIPVIFAEWMQNTVSSKWVFLLLLNITLFITGCLIDIFSAIMIILPLLSPLGAVYGIDPVHLGIIFLINMEAGFLTPPVGLNLFLASYRFKKPFVEISRNVFPFLVIQLVVVFIVTYIPALSTFLKGFF